MLFAPPKTEPLADVPKAGGGAAVEDPEEPNAGGELTVVLFPANGLGTAAKLNPPLFAALPEEPKVPAADCPNVVCGPLVAAPKMPAVAEDADELDPPDPKIFPEDCAFELFGITELAAVVVLGDATLPNENPATVNE